MLKNQFYNKAFSTNDRLKSLCSKENVEFLNLWNHFYDQRILFNHDGLHLNPVGSARLGRLLSDAVEAHRTKNGGAEGVSDPLPKIRRETPVQRQQLKVCLVNARSLRNKFHDLAAIAFLENFDIIGVTESWVNTEKRDFLAEYNIQGYSLFSCERSERTGGGVLLYVKPHLHPQVITKPQISNIDVKYVQILSGSEKLILALVYRPPAQIQMLTMNCMNRFQIFVIITMPLFLETSTYQ